MRHLLVEDSDEDGRLALTLTADGRELVGQAPVPFLELQRLGVEELLVSGQVHELADRAQNYAAVLRRLLQRAFDGLDDLIADGLRVEVRCGARAQALVWETLRLPGNEEHAVTVIRSVPGELRRPRPEGACDLVWLAARAVKDSIPRYRVAGPVLAGLFEKRTITPLQVSTASTPAMLRSLDLPPDPLHPRIVHLDVHGATRVDVGGETGEGEALIASSFVAHFGAEVMSDAELGTVLANLGCDVFVSNACHGGDLRDSARLPFPARSILAGARAAVVARGPVPEQVAAIFHPSMYVLLASGTTLTDAHSTAVAASARSLGKSRDRRAQALVQPMLWLATAADGDEALCTKAPEPEKAVFGGAYFLVAAESGSIEAALIALEQEVADGRSLPEIGFADPDLGGLSRQTLRTMLRWAMGDPADELPPEPDGPTRLLRIPALTFTERCALLRFAFRGTSILIDILAVFVPGDLLSIAASATLSGDDPATALLRAAETGAWTGKLSGRQAEGAERARSVLRQFPDNEVIRACLTLPILSVEPGSELAGAPIPQAPSALLAEKRDWIKVKRAGDGYFLVPDRSVREAARVLTRPKILTAVRLKFWTGLGQRPKLREWDAESAWACATHLVLATAARQTGIIDTEAMACISALLRNTSHTVVADLLRALHQGLPHWPEIHPELRGVWDKLVEDYASLSTQRFWPTEATEDDGNTSTATAREATPQVAPGLTEREQTRFSAYRAAHNGGLAAALSTAVELLATASIDDRFDYCECLHLLGDVQERLGRDEAAARWFLKERDIGPPSDNRRLHNRDHLYELLEAKRRDHGDLLYTLAHEGVVIARRMADAESQGRFLTRTLNCGLNELRESWVRESVGQARGHPRVDPNLIHLADGFLLVESDPPQAIRELSQAAGGDDAIAAHALLFLSEADTDNALEHLARGARTSGGKSYRLVCLYRLLDGLMRRGRAADLRAELAQLPEDFLSLPVALYGRAGLAYLDDEQDKQNRLTEALMADGGQLLPRLASIGVSADQLPLQALIDAVERLTERIQDRVRLREPGTDPPGGLAALADAARNIARLAGFFDLEGRRWVVDLLLQSSERAWDGGSLAHLTLATALRSHACELLTDLGESEDLARLATELGWLATLHRQRGRPTEAESLFQRAIELARDHLPAADVASLIGRYGNLMHDLGEFGPAVHLQWSAIRAGLPAADLPSEPSAALSALAAVAAEPDAAQPQWDILLVNFANCLASAGESAIARAVIEWMASRAADRPPTDEVVALIVGVAHRTNLAPLVAAVSGKFD
jgi:tetratricopeptide (TPR) repeat protein